jgi:hypothetical protein
LNSATGLQLPQHFRVSITEGEKRCPTLLLEAVEAPPEVTDAGTRAREALPDLPLIPEARWQNQFLVAAAEWVSAAGEDGAVRAPLDLVLSDLRVLLRKDPGKLTLLLLAGYLHVGNTLSLRHGDSGDNLYTQAAESLAQVTGGVLPDGVLTPLLPQSAGPENGLSSQPEKERKGWLRRFCSIPFISANPRQKRKPTS